jgi:hypothetical protein
VLTTKGAFLSPYQAIARRVRGTVEARYLDAGDAIYHVNDKWIEPKDNPTRPELTAYARQVVMDTVGSLAQTRRFDVVFVEARTGLLADADIGASLLAFLRSGGVVVVVGNYYPDPGGPLAACWPANATSRNTWMTGGSMHADGPMLAGVPTDYLTGHTWIPIAAAANAGSAIATGEAGALFSASIGTGTLLYCPTGPMSQRWDAMDSIVWQYDHDDIWLRYWDQALYEAWRGKLAFPAYTDKFTVAPIIQNKPGAGASFHVSGVVVNRDAGSSLTGSLHVVDDKGGVVYRTDVGVGAPVGGSMPVAVDVPVSPS